MRRRIFIAINLSESVKKRLFDFKEKWDNLPVRWTKKDSLHLTLVFIGYVSDDEMFDVCRLVREIAREHEPADLEFEKILYGPPSKPSAFAKASADKPRMIWLKGKPSKEVAGLKADLEKSLMSLERLGSFKIETRPFSPHITLARIKMGQWHDMPELPKIEQDFKAVVPVESIEVMESDLKSDGAEYVILESCPLNG